MKFKSFKMFKQSQFMMKELPVIVAVIHCIKFLYKTPNIKCMYISEVQNIQMK